MKLFLASDASNPNTIESLDNYVNGLRDKNVIYIPTAKNGQNPFGSWRDSDTWKMLKKNVNAKALQLEEYYNGLPLQIFKDTDVIWMSGGASGYLMYWIIKTGFDLLLPKILESSIYVGSSAGSMITGPNLDVSDWYIGEDERGAKYIPSLRLVDFDIYPHYNEKDYDQIKSLYKGKKLYLLKDGENIIVDDDKIIVDGEERIIENRSTNTL